MNTAKSLIPETVPAGFSRRAFMCGGAAMISTMIVAPNLVRGAEANSKISLGLIGCGSLKKFSRYALITHAVDSGLRTSSLSFLSFKTYISFETMSEDSHILFVMSSIFSRIGVCHWARCPPRGSASIRLV